MAQTAGPTGASETPAVATPVLTYQPAPAAARGRARALRVGMLVLAVLAFQLAALLVLNPLLLIGRPLGAGAMGTPFAPVDPTIGDEANQLRYLPRALAYLGLFLLMQWMFLARRGGWRIDPSPNGPLPRRAALAAGFIGMLLSVGLLAIILELPDWWLLITTDDGIKTPQRFYIVWPIMLVIWAFWSIAIASYSQSLDRYTAMSRIFRWLVAGTILELVIAAPAHAWILDQRGDECYCQRGTWTGIAFGATSALWLFGPAAILLFMREHRRRRELI